MTLLKKSVVVVLAGAVSIALIAAPSATARNLKPGESQWVTLPSDVTTTKGKAKDSFTNAIGRTIPTGCTNPKSGKSSAGRESLDTVVSQREYAGRVTWNSSVWTYRTDAAARTSFDQLRRQSASRCNVTYDGSIGDDGANVPAKFTLESAQLPTSSDPAYPQFFVSISQVLKNPATAPPGYATTHYYLVFSLVDNAIVEAEVFQPKVVSAAQRANVQSTSTAIGVRYANSF